ncbi:MAG TPA: hypothetical protein VGH76_02580 [Actinomycetospora sp.]|jgi:CP family cyanate transporter-like MFS transporter|uniref:hypothetical protein n=1 Tax=Actinomycetospora sp. TaxID=1872135 RepID=UPI002F3E38A5
MQTGGYAVGALGPTVLGALHGGGGAWTPALVLVLGAVGVLGASGLAATRSRPRS